MSNFRKSIISIFILFNLLTMIRVHLHLDTKFFWKMYRPIDGYLSFFSTYQDWMMFAPDPGKLNSNIEAEVEFDDGSIQTYIFPRSTNIFDKYTHGEKFRKLTTEGIRKDDNSFLWNDTAKFVLRKLRDDNYSKIPLKVHLIRALDEIPDVSKEFRLHSESPKKYNQVRFYTYEVI